MDPLTAVGLVGNILAFIDFSVDLLRSVKEIHDASNGILGENRTRETVVREMASLSAQLLPPKETEPSDGDSPLVKLARECSGLAIKLIELLDKIKPKDPDSKGQILLSALKSKTYEKEREDLEMQLGNCRSQLELQLNFISRKETLEKFEFLISASKNDELKLAELHKQVEQLRIMVESSTVSPNVQSQLKLLLCTEEEVFRTIAKERILNSLSFEGMDRRENMVAETHSNTYAWVVEDDKTIEEASCLDETRSERSENSEKNIRYAIEDEEKFQTRAKLSAWLTAKHTSDIFHLSGKLGSGKSTLMKSIIESPRTAERLEEWADGRKLTIAKFYFRNAGSEYEKSLRGLYRSLLHQTLRGCPELIPTALPAYHKEALSAPWVTPKTIKIAESEIKEALCNIIKSPHLYENKCFCLFIDGLDEFHETIQDDYRDLVNLLRPWASASPRHTKICVSSRENLVFMDAFSKKLRIRLHELTRHDMDIYIRDRLAHASEDPDLKPLVSSIIEKANGVFLWVALVVKSLREGLDNGQSCAYLKHDVDILPDELGSLYTHTLRSLGKKARERAYQTFAMVTELKKYDYRLSLLAYSFLNDYVLGKICFIEKTQLFKRNDLTGSDGEERLKSSTKNLAGWCKGLVETYDNTETKDRLIWDLWTPELDFTHRTVLEFLDSESEKAKMDLYLHKFDHVDAISSLLMVDILFDTDRVSQRTRQTTHFLLKTRQDYGLDCAQSTYLDRLRVVMYAGVPPLRIVHISSLWNKYNDYDKVCRCVGNTSAMKTLRNQPEYHVLADPLHKLTWSGLCDYPVWYITHNAPELSRQLTVLSMLACCCIWRGNLWYYHSGHQHIRVLEALFGEGLLSPGTITDCHPLFEYTHGSTTIPGLTIWQYFMLGLISRYCAGAMSVGDGIEEIQSIGNYLELFLRFKPDLYFSCSIYGALKRIDKRRFSCNFESPSRVIGIELMLTVGQLRGLRPTKCWDAPETAASMREDLSPRQLVELCPFDNKWRILQLIDAQLERNARSGAEAEELDRDTPNSRKLELGHHATAPMDGNGTGSCKADEAFGIVAPSIGALMWTIQWIAVFLKSDHFKYGLAALMGAIISLLTSHA